MIQARFDKSNDASWRNGLRFGSDIETERAALEAFDDAVAMAREGHFQSARQICVVVVFLIQPSIAARPNLLRATLHALLVSHGFSLLSRVVMAIDGRGVDVTMLPECIGDIEAPRRQDEARRTALLADPRWLAQLSPDDPFLSEWCDGLSTGKRRWTERDARTAGSRQLERT
jgi:hypothetical protein